MKFDKVIYAVVCIAASLLLVTANAAAIHITDKHIILSQPIKPLPFYRERIAVVYKDPKVKSDLPGYVCVYHSTDVFTWSVKQQHDRQSIALAVKLCNTPEVKKALKKLGLTPIYQSATIYKFPDFSEELDVLLMNRYGRKVGCLAIPNSPDTWINTWIIVKEGNTVTVWDIVYGDMYADWSVKQQHDRQSIALAVKLCNTPEVKKALKKLGLTPIYQSATIYKFPDFSEELDVLLMNRYGRKVGCLAKIGTDDNYIIEIAVTSTYNPTIEKVYLIKVRSIPVLLEDPATLNTLFASMLTRTRVAITPMWLQVWLNDICKPQIKVAYKAAIFKILDIYDLPLPHSRVSTIHYTDVYVFAPNQVGYR